MRTDLETTLLRRAFALREARTTSMADDVYREPTLNYTGSERFEQERAALFSGAPLIAGLSCDLPLTGSYFTVNLVDVPVLVLRGEDGFVRAFLNVCRHRAANVADGRGNPGRVFKCPYHAWSYDINGQLLGQPSAVRAFEGVDSSCTGLISLPAAESGGVIYVRPKSGGEPIDPDTELAGLAPELGDVGFENFVLLDEKHQTWTMNWKQPYDSFLESYHIFALHRDSLSKETLSTPMLTDDFGPHSRGIVLQRSAIALLDKPESEWVMKNNANQVYWLFPNTVLNLPAPGHAELWQFYPDNGRVDGTRVHVRFYAQGEPRSESQRDFWKRMVDFTMNFVAEDFVQQERIFQNLKSGLLSEMIYGRNEPALIHFHKSLEAVLKN
jgi:phenylpropionate dioxygenase-like ring-hydroxylating dioxygenase large terminal subunit